MSEGSKTSKKLLWYGFVVALGRGSVSLPWHVLLDEECEGSGELYVYSRCVEGQQFTKWPASLVCYYTAPYLDVRMNFKIMP